MTASVVEYAEILARALSEDRLVALIGSGASSTYQDASGRKYQGLPTPSEFVSITSKLFPYVDKDMPFNLACDEIFGHEQRAGLEDVLLRYYRVQEAVDIPPAQRILSWLPFAMYITSNYDQFTERSLERESKRPYVLIENDDLIRLRRWHTPVIKYHGCVSRPRTLVAATRDYVSLDQRRALLAKLISVSLAGKTLLVVGHGLGDSDLAQLIDAVVGDLSEYGPTIVVLREPGKPERLSQVRHPVEVVSEDLTTFLNRLLHAYRALQQTDTPRVFDERWLSSAFFAELKQAASLPSETQVIDAFLRHLHEEYYARDDIEGVLSDAQVAITATLEDRPNYGALKRTWAVVKEALRVAATASECEDCVADIIEERTSRITSFTRSGKTLIQPNDRILLFSQSQRVLQALRGASVNSQRTCHVFIAECRPKSPRAYQDAEAICRELSDTHYRVTVCPDVVAINLIANRQIDKVIVGTHALYFDDESDPLGSIHSYVNTCGSLAIDIACQAHGVPIYVIGESLKLECVLRSDRDDHLHSHEENDLLVSAVGLRDLRTKRDEIGHLNIGYDLVPLGAQTKVIVPDFPGMH